MPQLHQSKAVVGSGELLANFPLRMKDERQGENKYRGTVVCLHAAPEVIEESSYGISMGLVFEGGEETYESHFQAPFAANMTAAMVGERLDAYNAKARGHYPYLTRLPHISYERENNVLGHFILRLPPFTSVYTSTRGFFDTLGFEEGSYREFPGVRMKHAPNVTVLAYGFTNRKAETLEIVSRDQANDSAVLKITYDAVAGPNPTARPHLELRMFQDVLPLGLSKKRPMSKTLVMDSLATVLNDGLNILSVDTAAVFVEASGKNLIIKSKEYRRPGATKDAAAEEVKVTVVVTLSTELKDFLQVDSDKLEFPLGDARNYEVEPLDEESFDIFGEFYPISLVLQQGIAKNFIEDRGFTSLLAVMRGRDDFVGEGSIFYGDCDQLTVRFLDKRLQPVKLRERSTTLILTLELEPLF